MLYYYNKIIDGFYVGKYYKVTVDDKNHLGTKEDPFMIIDAGMFDEIEDTGVEPLYQNIQNGLCS